MTPASTSRQPPWPWRWLLTELAPGLGVVALAVGAVALGWRGLGGPPPAAVVSGTLAAALAVVYTRRLRELVRLRREIDPASAAGRDELARCLRSVAVRGVTGSVILLVFGLPAAVAVTGGIAASLVAGYAQLTRQVAIVETFREAEE